MFIGHGETFVNDKHPRACNADGSPKGAGDWSLTETWIEGDAAIGARDLAGLGLAVQVPHQIGARVRSVLWKRRPCWGRPA